jgi:4-hydroxy-tetrahydrodipicolinate reductase
LEKLLEEKKHCPLIIGTTGDLPMDLIKEYGKCAPVALSSNFSDGINEFVKMISTIDKSKWDVSLIEKHHIHKVDKPSGTAKLLAMSYGNEYIKPENISSIREGEIIGEHELVLNNGTETLTIIHSVKTRNVFAKGALEWVKKMAKKTENGIYIKI